MGRGAGRLRRETGRNRRGISAVNRSGKGVEGGKRQLRRMTAAAGFPTLRLVRWAIGPLTLEGLKPGEWREMEPDEVRRVVGG